MIPLKPRDSGEEGIFEGFEDDDDDEARADHGVTTLPPATPTSSSAAASSRTGATTSDGPQSLEDVVASMHRSIEALRDGGVYGSGIVGGDRC